MLPLRLPTERARAKQGLLRCLKEMIGIALLSLILAGCSRPASDQGERTRPSDRVDDRKPSAASLEDLAYRSLQDRDTIRAKKLRELKGTKYDGKRMEAISSAGNEASKEASKILQPALAARLDKIQQDDQAAFDAVLEELARGAERAGAK